MIRVQTNRGLDGKFKKVSDMLDGYRDRYLELMSAEIIENSPVDTGTYIMQHYVDTMEVDKTVDSPTDPALRGKSHGQFSGKAYSKMQAEIKNLPAEAVRAVISNATVYANVVEYEEGHGYLVYTQAAREHGRIARQAAEDVKNG